ncbi:MAG: hypothetical protein RR436_00345 [Clostridia bacterium]
MCKLFEKWAPQIKECCEKNNLSFEKACKLSKAWGKDDIVLQYFDKSKNDGRGLLNETPLPIVLYIYINDGVVTIEQTENTQKYLSI